MRVENRFAFLMLAIALLPVAAGAQDNVPQAQSASRKIDFGIELVRVPGGTFTMGCTPEQGTECYDSEKPAHQVTVSPFEIGRTEVTQAQWQAVTGNNPSMVKGEDLPVEMVSWDDAQEFIRKLNGRTGENCRLPTDAEWEYAAREGKDGSRNKYSGGNDLENLAWIGSNSEKRAHEVGTKSPNALGIYDMSGNMWEWVQDWYGDYNSDAQTDPGGPSSGQYRVIRSGSWRALAVDARVSKRFFANPGNRNDSLGFRLACSSK